MIVFKELRWGNAFSYGPSNTLRLDEYPLIQLMGENGHGKSSIALLLEEVLYNQNSKKIKKGNILNRYIKDKSYYIELDFDSYSDNYQIKTNRTNTTNNVKLLKNGADISSHTATGTYKAIETIIGYDHKTFSQIVYQSSVSSLEFLTATDTERKRFLIELLNLSRYPKGAEVFKELASTCSKQVDSINTKLSTINAWLNKYKDTDLTEKVTESEPVEPSDLVAKVAIIREQVSNIDSINLKIANNNKHKEAIVKNTVGVAPPRPPTNDSIIALKVSLATIQNKLKEGKHISSACTSPTSTCSSCNQVIDNSTKYSMVQSFMLLKPQLEAEAQQLATNISEGNKKIADWDSYSSKVLEVQRLHSLIDTSLGSAALNASALLKEISDIEITITNTRNSISRIRTANKLIIEHNAKISAIVEQMADMKGDLSKYSKELDKTSLELSKLQTLVKAFSSTGLVAYKIECLIKDLEAITNEYLLDLADGRFQLNFRVTSTDKLNVVIIDNGNEIDINALSSGERARVNIAALLSIRKLLQTLSNNRANLLILDETIANLDTLGKERLVEVLLQERLNTIVVSHDFSHPLVEKLTVIKNNNISRLETI